MSPIANKAVPASVRGAYQTRFGEADRQYQQEHKQRVRLQWYRWRRGHLVGSRWWVRRLDQVIEITVDLMSLLLSVDWTRQRRERSHKQLQKLATLYPNCVFDWKTGMAALAEEKKHE